MTDVALSERLPTAEETEAAAIAVSELGKLMTKEKNLPLFIPHDGAQEIIELPSAVGEIVLEILGHVANGDMLTIVPYGAMLTTQQSADILNVSRPHLIKLLDRSEIAHHKVGKHRRILAKDLLAYKEKRDKRRSDALLISQRLGQQIQSEIDAKEAAN